MNGRSNVLNRSLFFVLVLVLIFAQWPSSHSLATMSIKLIMDGKDITSLSSPIIEMGEHWYQYVYSGGIGGRGYLE